MWQPHPDTNAAFVSVNVAVDETYARLEASYNAAPNKAKWKMAVRSSDGSRSIVRRDTDGFYSQRAGERIVTIAYTMAHEQRHNVGLVGGDIPVNSRDEWVVAVNANLTGNHAGKVNHRVAVPTKAGQPVRG
jgi:hypothetical protein